MNLTKRSVDSGLALPVVLIVGAVGFLGAATVTIITSQGLLNSVRGQQERQSREIADAGIAQTIELLNSDHPSLLINCYQNDSGECTNLGSWTNPSKSYQCPKPGDSDTELRDVAPFPTANLEKTISTTPNGSFKILSYVFDGNRFYGGVGTLTVEGNIYNADGSKQLSRSVLKKTFNVKPQDCPQGEDPDEDTSGFGGICAKQINMGNNDVYGAISGNVICTDCEFEDPDDDSQEAARDLIGASNQSVITGSIFIGGQPCPDVYEFPSNLLTDLLVARGYDPDTYDGTMEDYLVNETKDLQSYVNKADNKYVVESRLSPGVHSNNMCVTDSGNNTDVSGVLLSNGEPFTYCLVDNILLSSTEQLEVDTSDGPVKIYTLNDVDVGGQRSITQTGTGDITPFRLGLYGRNEAQCQAARVEDSTFQQEAYFSGVSAVKGKGKRNSSTEVEGTEAKAANIHVHFPCGKVGINGGAQSTVDQSICNFDDETITVDNYEGTGRPPYGDCGGGDVRGVVWAENWDGSNSNQAQLVVPTNSPNQTAENLGEEFLVSVKSFVAIGTPSWSGIGRVIE